MDNFGLQPPTPPAPPPPPTPPIPPVPPEQPVITKPTNQFGNKVKKNGIKIISGVLMAVLIVGGALLGTNLMKEKQRPVEKQAAETCSNDENTVLNCRGKDPGYEFCLVNGPVKVNMVCLAQSGSLLGCGQIEGGNACDDYVQPGDPDDSDLCSRQTNPCGYYGCRKWICPQGDTNNDGTCGPSPAGTDIDAYSVDYSAVQCENLTCEDDCCQIDWFDSDGPYCEGVGGWACKEVDLVCPPPQSSPEPSPSPSPSPSLSCVDLSKNVTAPKLNDEVTFTCEANFSGDTPVAYFAHSVNGDAYTFDSTAYPISPTTKTASKTMTINQLGSWSVQCRVCTDNTATNCTTWGQAN